MTPEEMRRYLIQAIARANGALYLAALSAIMSVGTFLIVVLDRGGM